MSDGLTLTVDSASPAIAALRQLAARVADMTPVMEDIGAYLESQIQQRFDLQSDPQGASWAPLAPATLASYVQQHRGVVPGSLLNRTGLMRGGLSHRATASQVEVGFAVPYAGYHEFGTQRMPRRGLITADPETATLAADDEQAIVAIVAAYLAP